MERDSREKFAADLRRQEVISPDWRKVRLSTLFAVVLALAGLGLGRMDPAYAMLEHAFYVAASVFGLAVLALMQWKRLFVRKPPME